MLRRLSISILPLATIAAVSVTGGCSDDTGPQDSVARLTIALTDAPDPMFAEALVEIGAVTLIPAGGPPVTLTDAGGTHDLLMLQDGVMVDLATLDIDPGRYLQLRLVVLSASVTTQMSKFPLRFEAKAIWLPSGDHVGRLSVAGSVVIWVSVLSATVTTQMSRFPLRIAESKAI